ncbi:MAG: hypothetical protein ACREK8_07425 [Gemmatimonadales bacterium]
MNAAAKAMVCGAVLGVAVAARLRAQETAPLQWTLEDNQGSYCIWYLADPELASQMVPAGTVLSPAGSGKGLPVLLSRTIRDEPRFNLWIPGAICIGAYRRVTADGRTVAAGKDDHPIIIATSYLAARDPRGVAGATNLLLSFMTDKRDVARASESAGFDMNGISVVTRQQVGADDPKVTISVDGVEIVWSGHAIGDSGVGKTRSVSFGYATNRNASWLIGLDSRPSSTRLMAGILEVAGRNTLAKALKASPVRGIGPEESGGTVTLTFHKEIHK